MITELEYRVLEFDVRGFLLQLYMKMGIDKPSNHEDIVEFVVNDIIDSADLSNWNDDDVRIGFRRFLEKNSEKA